MTGSVGAIVTGVDLASVTADSADAITDALREHLVLFFPAQHLPPAAQLAFGRAIGELDIAPFGRSHPEIPELTVLDQRAPRGEGTDAWHSDNTFRADPPKFTMLQAVQLPAVGGDTCWADMHAAYDALSPALQRMLDGLTARHDLTKMLRLAIDNGHSDADLAAMQQRYPPVHHPVVRTHPESGRRALFVNGNFATRIDQLSAAESDNVLRFLFDHVQTPEFQCRFRWTEGALALWDNRSLQHFAVPDYDERRVMHRLTIRGEQPA